jgi:NAD(P)-dependent dehydrogenase (short-subunit alcohol dehydrogenase family)
MDVNQRVEWMRENSIETYEEAKQCMKTNYYGAKIVTEALLPLLQLSSCGRIVNVSSGFGLLRVSCVNIKAVEHRSLPTQVSGVMGLVGRA